ncbi:MAG TPA: AAA family ATPase [Acidimicrobiales bacterium]|nr:AAA family ATPase [Acidimicrobiales bacterium]
MLERDGDLAELAAHLDRARAGRGGMILVTGESGAGKSTLLQGFADGFVDDMPVLWSSCDPLSPPRPLGPFHDLADQLGEGVRSSLRDARQSHEIFSAVFDHLRLHPSVLVVDDLHWADQGTIDLLRFLLRRIRITHSLVVAALRDDEIGPTHRLRSLLGDIARSADATSTSLRPLSIDAIRTLAKDRAVDPLWLRDVTGGNPFFVVEMIDYEGGDIPRTVRDAVLARTTELAGDSWDLLHLLACATKRSPIICSPVSASGFSRCAWSTMPGSSGEGLVAWRSGMICAGSR